MNKSFAIIGLGTFGRQLCESLADGSTNILAVDNNEAAVNAIADIIPHAVYCDYTREENLNKLNLREVDHVILAIGSNMPSTILCTVILKEMGVKDLIVRVDDNYYIPIIKKLGADHVVNPLKLAVQSLSASLLSRSFTDFYDAGENYGVASIHIKNPLEAVPLQDMNVRAKFNINILLIKRGGKTLVPVNTDVFMENDEIIVFGKKASISKFDKSLSG